MEGEGNARKAHGDAVQAFGPQSALASGVALPLANCLIGLGNLQEASQLLANINVKAASQLAGDPDWGAGVTLAQAEIAARQGAYNEAQRYLEAVRPVFSPPDAEAYQRRKMDELTDMSSSRLRAN
jgi:ATP/maltotriose-dependent transcriptional regulator MalT